MSDALTKAKPFACSLDLIPSGVMKGLQHSFLTLLNDKPFLFILENF